MIRFRLLDFLNRSKFLQLLIGWLPNILSMLYIMFFLFSISDIYYVIETNNELVKTNPEGTLHKVEITDNTAEFQETLSRELNLKLGDKVLTAECRDENWIMYILDNNLDPISVHDSQITGVGKKIDYKVYEYSIFSQTIKAGYGDKLFDIYLNKEGTFDIIVYDNGKEVATKTLDEVKGITTLKISDDSVTLKVTNTGVLTSFDNTDILYASELPTDDVYFDINNRVFIKNIAPNFASNLLWGMSYVTVLVSMIIFSVLYFYAYKVKLLSELGATPAYYITSYLVVLSLLIEGALVFIMFS